MKRLTCLAAAAAIAFTLAAASNADAQAKIKFKWSKGKMDLGIMKARAVPNQELDILNNPVSWKVVNKYGVVYVSPQISGDEMDYNDSLTKFMYKEKRTGLPQVRKLQVKSRPERYTGKTEYYFKIKVEADISAADPKGEWNATATIDDLDDIYVEFKVGDAPFYINGIWEEKRYGWSLSAKDMSTWYRRQ